jgi:hypothetical protein
MTNTVQYRKSSDTGAGPSPAIWADCPIGNIQAQVEQGSGGILVEDYFPDYSSTATTVINKHGMPTFEGACTIGGVAGRGGGVALFGTTDNQEAALEQGGSQAAPFVIPVTSSTDGYKLWFECRIKKSTIADAIGGFFVGLAGEGAGVADFIADAGADFADVDLLGFWNDETDDSVGSHVHLVTQKTGAAFDTIVDTFDTLVADTYVKLGFVYDPGGPDTKKIRFYADGTESGTYVGEDSGDATVFLGDTTNFPGGEEMTPLVAIKMASGTDMTVTMDWWRCAQLGIQGY